MRRNFLKSGLLLIASAYPLPFIKGNNPISEFIKDSLEKSFPLGNKQTFFHINSSHSFWKIDSNRKSLIDLLDSNKRPLDASRFPEIEITISSENSEHLKKVQRISAKLSNLGINHRITFLSEDQFWNNWQNYEFSLVDWVSTDRTNRQISNLFCSPQSKFCLSRTRELISSSSSQLVAEHPFRWIATPV